MGEQRSAFQTVTSVFNDLGLVYFASGGTLIALLRYGEMIGELSDGKFDVVDRDMDWMVRVTGLQNWFDICLAISKALVARGWRHCELMYEGIVPIWAGQYY